MKFLISLLENFRSYNLQRETVFKFKKIICLVNFIFAFIRPGTSGFISNFQCTNKQNDQLFDKIITRQERGVCVRRYFYYLLFIEQLDISFSQIA